MRLVQLIYSSVAEPGLRWDAFREVMVKAEAHNRAHDITGALVFGNGYFLQVLEGGRTAVNDLYLRIARDPRHSDCQVVACADIDARTFADWSMKIVGPDVAESERRRRVLLQHSGRATFDPRAMSSGQSFHFLAALAEIERRAGATS